MGSYKKVIGRRSCKDEIMETTGEEEIGPYLKFGAKEISYLFPFSHSSDKGFFGISP